MKNKYQRGLAPIAILIIVLLVAVIGYVAYHAGQNAQINAPVDNNVIVNTEPNPPVVDNTGCISTSTPSITVLSPLGGEAYTLGQSVTIKWTSCNVSNVSLGLVSGGKDFGELTQTPIPAVQGSYQWVATNPGLSFTGNSTNSYQVGIFSTNLTPEVLVRSGIFTVASPVSTNSLTIGESNIRYPSNWTYQKINNSCTSDACDTSRMAGGTFLYLLFPTGSTQAIDAIHLDEPTGGCNTDFINGTLYINTTKKSCIKTSAAYTQSTNVQVQQAFDHLVQIN